MVAASQKNRYEEQINRVVSKNDKNEIKDLPSDFLATNHRTALYGELKFVTQNFSLKLALRACADLKILT